MSRLTHIVYQIGDWEEERGWFREWCEADMPNVQEIERYLLKRLFDRSPIYDLYRHDMLELHGELSCITPIFIDRMHRKSSSA